jgi:hypothetical protein
MCTDSLDAVANCAATTIADGAWPIGEGVMGRIRLVRYTQDSEFVLMHSDDWCLREVVQG